MWKTANAVTYVQLYKAITQLRGEAYDLVTESGGDPDSIELAQEIDALLAQLLGVDPENVNPIDQARIRMKYMELRAELAKKKAELRPPKPEPKPKPKDPPRPEPPDRGTRVPSF